MRSYIKQKIGNLLDKMGYQRYDGSKEIAYVQFYDHVKHIFAPKNNDITSIIFSKDRTMQLDAFLSSYFEHVQNYSKMIVLYRVTSEPHGKSYLELMEIYKDYPVEFVEEVDFRNQLLTILQREAASRVFFYVDDMLFTHDVDYDWFSEIDPMQDLVCLSRGQDLIYSTVLAKPLKTPAFAAYSADLYRFQWNEIAEFSDWTYPLGVSGYMFSRPEIVSLFNSLSFKAPNSLETAMQYFLPNFINRGGICLKNVATPCIHANLTQTEGYNNVLGHFSIEDLLALWESKKRIDIKQFYNLPVSEAEVKKYEFIDR